MVKCALALTVAIVLAGCQSSRPAPPAPPAATAPDETGAKPQAMTGASGAAGAQGRDANSQATQAATTQAAGEENQKRVVTPFPDITVRLEPDAKRNSVEVKAWACLDEGLLEQVACGPASREHESLVVIKARASQIHAALLMAGFEPGSPGKWTYDNQQLGTIAPKGPKLEVLVRYADPKQPGKTIERPVREWIRSLSAPGRESVAFPKEPWVFGGSVVVPNPKGMEPGEHYVADSSGSIIGLVTFGDEVIGFSRVLVDQEAVHPLDWEVNTQAIPPLGTEVTIVLRAWEG